MPWVADFLALAEHYAQLKEYENFGLWDCGAELDGQCGAGLSHEGLVFLDSNAGDMLAGAT